MTVFVSVMMPRRSVLCLCQQVADRSLLPAPFAAERWHALIIKAIGDLLPPQPSPTWAYTLWRGESIGKMGFIFPIRPQLAGALGSVWPVPAQNAVCSSFYVAVVDKPS